MTDQIVPPGPDQPVSGPDTPPASPPAPSPPTTDWEGKYKGMITVLATKDKDLDKLKGEVGTLSDNLKELQDTTTAAQATADAAKVNADQQIAELTGKITEGDTKLETAAAYRVKMEALKEYPDLIGLADTIPNITDEETMKSHLETLSKQVDLVAEQKAERKAAGFTPGPTTPTQGAYPFDSFETWGEALKKAAGTKEFAKIDDAFGSWMHAQGQSEKLPVQKVHTL